MGFTVARNTQICCVFARNNRLKVIDALSKISDILSGKFLAGYEGKNLNRPYIKKPILGFHSTKNILNGKKLLDQ